MVQEKISMRKIKEALRLHYQFGHSNTQIANSMKIGATTVGVYLNRVKMAKISWPQIEALDEAALEQLLYPPKNRSTTLKVDPDFVKIHIELKRKGVTLQLLWEEYFGIHPNGYAYSRFCDLYKQWAKTKDIWMPQVHKAGEKVFVDYAGQTIPVYDSVTKAFFQVQIFVSAIGASSYIYAEAVQSQSLENWIASHCNMFQFYGGVTEIIVPDNLKAGVTLPHLYEPECNATYLEMAQYYGCAIIPARVRKPQDKAKVENAVLQVERQILAKMRDKQFFSLAEVNGAIRIHLDELNSRPYQKIPGSRLSCFRDLDKPCLKALPAEPYELACWEKQTVNGSYHVNVKGHNYSVPHQHIKQKVEIRYNEKIVEIFLKGDRIALHKRNFEFGKFSTNTHHRPATHQYQADISPENLLKEAEKVGSYTRKWIETVLADPSKHIQQLEKTCLGTLKLSKTYGKDRLEKACQRGLHFKAFTCKSILSILKNSLDCQAIVAELQSCTLSQQHENIRGPNYYDESSSDNKNAG